MSLVVVENLNKKYVTSGGDISVLKDLSLTITRGKLAVVMGSSGSGKTTLLHLLGALDHADSGSIYVEKKDITRFSAWEKVLYRRSQVGFVFQQFNLVPTLSALENVALPLYYAGLKHSQGLVRAKETLEELGLGERISHRPALLSGGEQQRVAIARALIHQPSLILADEPTGNLDSQNAKKILKLLKKIRDERALTILLVTHDPGIAQEADEVFHLKDGVLVKNGG